MYVNLETWLVYYVRFMNHLEGKTVIGVAENRATAIALCKEYAEKTGHRQAHNIENHFKKKKAIAFMDVADSTGFKIQKVDKNVVLWN